MTVRFIFGVIRRASLVTLLVVLYAMQLETQPSNYTELTPLGAVAIVLTLTYTFLDTPYE